MTVSQPARNRILLTACRSTPVSSHEPLNHSHRNREMLWRATMYFKGATVVVGATKTFKVVAQGNSLRQRGIVTVRDIQNGSRPNRLHSSTRLSATMLDYIISQDLDILSSYTTETLGLLSANSQLVGSIARWY